MSIKPSFDGECQKWDWEEIPQMGKEVLIEWRVESGEQKAESGKLRVESGWTESGKLKAERASAEEQLYRTNSVWVRLQGKT